MHNYLKLTVWQEARALVKQIYQASENFPSHEQFGLTNQLRRAAVSIAANIAEGAGYSSPKKFAQFLQVANGSAYEVETHLFLAFDLAYLNAAQPEPLRQAVTTIQKRLFRLIQSPPTQK